MDTSVELGCDFDAISDVDQWLVDCDATLANYNITCVSITPSPFIVILRGSTQEEVHNVLDHINSLGLIIASTNTTCTIGTIHRNLFKSVYLHAFPKQTKVLL